ncbi:MAG TPA: hypothetical protein VJX67_23550 [Blastocatellia bacterium]|nr:hypothetical protein [Blastocatellia bacterium]
MTKRKCRFHCFMALALSAALASFGCDPGSMLQEAAPRVYGAPLAAVSHDLSVDVYIDSTLSMKGFLVPGVYSYYEQTLVAIERTLEKGWSQVNPAFHRFGTKIGDINGRLHVVAAKPPFYTDREYNKKTFIENVIKAADTTHLTVIVTDLFQDEADVSKLTGGLKQKYVRGNLAIGVLAIKSQFRGEVYDVGTKNYAFPYSCGEAPPERFRPFYLLILGGYSDVENFFVKMADSALSKFPQTHFVIFSEHLDSPAVSFANGRIVSLKGLVQVGGLLTRVKDDDARQLRLRGERGQFVANLNLNSLPNTLPFNQTSLDARVTAWKCVKGKLVEDKAAVGGLKVKSHVEQAGQLTVEEQIDASRLSGDGIYCFRVVLHPSSYLPDWVDQWDMDPNQIEDWRVHPERFDGSRTFNLRPLLKDLMDTMTEERDPELGELVCYVRKG